MFWNNKKVNINNYLEVFKDYPKSIKEVIRSAILDDTPIEPYIVKYKNNPYLFWEIKMSLDEGISPNIFKYIKSGDILDKIRQLSLKGINIKPLEKYLAMGLTDEYYKYILKWYEKGYALEKYKFNILPENILESFDYGLSLGYPMHIFNNGVQYSNRYIKACLKILSNKRQVNKYLDGNWDIDVLEMLSNYSRYKYYEKMVDFITTDITPSVLEEIYNCCKVGMPLGDISSVDSSGIYVYSSSQIKIIREAFIKGLDYNLLLNPELSIKDMYSIEEDMELNSKKKISGRL